MIFLWHALQCAIDNGAGFGAGDGARRTRAAIGIAADESETKRGGKIFGEPFVATNIAEKPFLVGNVGVLEKSRGNSCKFRAADRCVWLKIAARIAADDAMRLSVETGTLNQSSALTSWKALSAVSFSARMSFLSKR